LALHTRICDLLGIEVPILLAGMGQAATPALAAAVSNAGGLGVLGATGCSPARLRRWIRETRRLTSRPFGVDTILPASVRRAATAGGRPPQPPPELMSSHAGFAKEFMQREGLEPADREAMLRAAGLEPEDLEGPPPLSQAFFEAQMEVVIEERVPVYAAGLGSPGPWMDRLRANGTVVLSVVGAVKHLRAVLGAGVDAVVAQGSDGGGHNSPIGTLALIPQVVDAAGGVPVLGAGGIGDGRGVAAALMLGAEGAWIGTAFLATCESGIPDYQKRALLEADSSSTMVSRAVTGKPVRMLRGKWAAAWEESGREALPMPWQTVVSGPVMASAALHERADVNPGIAGQGVGLAREIRPAADVLRAIAAEAEAALRRAAALVAEPRR
jgi:NAD(P)H-dependent flavin oxidoreductase YrpB (nitropropane dioxygenase family)